MNYTYNTLYQKLYKYTSELVLLLNDEGRIEAANERANSLFKQSIIGKKIDALFEGINMPIASFISTEIVQSIYVRLFQEGGRKHPFLLSLIPLNEDDKEHRIMVVGKDLREIESYREEIDRLQGQIREMEEGQKLVLLEERGEHEAVSLAVALKKLEKTKEELEKINQNLTKELELASVLQKSLVPHQLPEDNYLQFAFYYEPMQFVGGDYYDVVNLGRGKKGVIVADVSGHGVSSAFIAAMLKISFFNYAPKYNSPAVVLNKLNQEYCNVIQTADYVTAFYAIFDPLHNKLTYCGAGHPRPLFFHGSTNKIETLNSKGFFIGMFEQAEYRDLTMELREGDRFLVFTDGIIEAYSDEKGEQFGENRLMKSFRDYCEQPIDQTIHLIVNKVKKFMQKSIFYDDLAIVAIEYKMKG